MSKIYLVKNTQATEAMNEWIEMNGSDFYKFIKSPEAKGRYFIKLPSLSVDSGDDTIVIESSKVKYVEWRKEERRKRYLHECEKGFTVISYHAMESDDGSFGEELIPDKSVDIEPEVELIMACEKLADALTKLNADERWLIDEIIVNGVNSVQLSTETGIPQQTISWRKIKILKKLKKFIW